MVRLPRYDKTHQNPECSIPTLRLARPRMHACMYVHANETLPETYYADDDDDDDGNSNNNEVRDGSSVLKREKNHMSDDDDDDRTPWKEACPRGGEILHINISRTNSRQESSPSRAGDNQHSPETRGGELNKHSI